MQAPIAQWIDPANAILTTGTITPQTTVTASATWPCFAPTNVNEWFVVDGMGQDRVYTGPGNTNLVADPSTSYGSRAFFSQIARVLGPTSAVLTTAPPLAFSGQPAHMLWGANDCAAFAAAGQDAYNKGYRKIYVPGNNRCYLLLACGTGDAAYPWNYATSPGLPLSAALNGVLWEGSNVRVYAWDGGGIRCVKECVPRASDTRRSLVRSIFKGHFRRCSQLTTINVLILGDSQGTPSPPSTMGAWMQSQRLVEEFQRANPGKVINVYWEAIGGATFASHVDPVSANFVDATGGTDSWNIPRPIVGTVPYRNLWSNINQTGVGPPIVPDVVFVMNNGGNDLNHLDAPAIHYMINYLQNIAHADGFGPCDVFLQTDDQTQFLIATLPNNAGLAYTSTTRYYEFSTMMIRSVAASRGLGCIDLAPLVQTAAYGWNPMQLALRQVPSQTVAATPAAPCVLPYECRDFSAMMRLGAAADAQVDIQISKNYGNRIILRFGANGHLWCGVAAYGDTVPTTCTISNGGTSLTVGAPTTLAGATYSNQAAFPSLNVQGAAFTAADVGKCLIAPIGHANVNGPELQRTFIRGYASPTDVILHDLNVYQSNIVNQTGNISYGGAIFLPRDSYAQPDVVIFYPDGTIFNTQVAYGTGYTSMVQVTLANPAPQALAAAVVPVFLGRMGLKWVDTGVAQSAMGAGDFLQVEVNRHELTLLYQPAARTLGHVILKGPVERYGGPFYPVFRPVASSQTIALSRIYIDDPNRTKVQPACTPWELRGVQSTAYNWYQGGRGDHPSSNLRIRVTDAVFDTNDLSTW